MWLAVVALAAGHLCYRFASGITLESNILALLPRAERDAGMQTIQDKLTESFSRRVVFLVGDISRDKAAAAARQLSVTLERSGMIASLTSRVDMDAQRYIGTAYHPYRLGLLSEADRAHLNAGDGKAVVSRALSILYGPGGLADSRLIARDPFLLMPSFLMGLPFPQSRLALDGDDLSVREGAITYVLVSANLAGHPYAMKLQNAFDAVVSGAIATLKIKTPDLTVLRTGPVFYAHDSSQEAMNETSIIGIASVVGTLALIFTVFHGFRPIVLGFVAIGTGVLCAFLGTLLIFGQIHVVALLFGVSLIGISVDYSLQYFCEYFDAGAPDPKARLRRVLPGVAMGLVTTLIGYFTLLLAPFPGLRQVATFSLIGLAASCLTVVLWYPPLDGRWAPSPDNRFVKLAALHWTFWEKPKLRWARIAIVAICGFAALLGLSHFRTDDDIRHLQSLSSDLKRQETEVESLTGTSSATQFLLVRGASEEALLETEERLVDRLSELKDKRALGGFTAVSQFVPSIARQRENRALVRQRLMAPYLADYLRQVGYEGAIDDAAPEGFLTPGDMPKVGPLAVLSMLDIANAGHPAHVVLLHGIKDIAAVSAAIAGLPGVNLVSPTDDWSRLFADYRRYAIALLALSALLMYPLLAWRYGLGRGLRVLVPSLAAVALAPPLAALAGVTFTFFNAMALVLVLSVGVDYSVFCNETFGVRKPVTTLAIALAALSTILSFGMLALSRVFAVHAFGITMLIGIILAFLFAPAAGAAVSPAQAKASI